MEEIAKKVTVYTSHGVEILAAVIIAAALIQVIYRFLQPLRLTGERIGLLRLQFGSSVAFALELLLGADVLATAVAPTWDAIGKLGAIAILRTALNYAVEKELKHPKDISRPKGDKAPSQSVLLNN